jgi:hypothetical protein
LYKNRRFKIVADNFLFKVPGESLSWVEREVNLVFSDIGLKSCLEAFEVTPGTVESCTQLLNDGNLLAISPGGVREALFSDRNYNLIWGKRCGFAKSAIAAKAVSFFWYI